MEVVSPTYTIVQYYSVNKNLNIAHYDLYRVKKVKELDNIGIIDQEYLFLNIIEWPDLIKNKNKNRIEISFNEDNISIFKITKNILEDLKKNKLQKVAGDASFRNFYRVNIKNKKYILIQNKKEKKIN